MDRHEYWLYEIINGISFNNWEPAMKAKNSYSHMLEVASARGTMAFFALISFFLLFFIIWSFASIGGAFVHLIRVFTTG